MVKYQLRFRFGERVSIHFEASQEGGVNSWRNMAGSWHGSLQAQSSRPSRPPSNIMMMSLGGRVLFAWILQAKADAISFGSLPSLSGGRRMLGWVSASPETLLSSVHSIGMVFSSVSGGHEMQYG